MSLPVLPEKTLRRKRRLIQENTINFCSNDYLALSRHPKLISSAQAALGKFGVGGKSSQLVSGHTLAHQEFETEFARFVKRDRALLFGNGYMANLGVLKSLCQRKDTIFQDRNNHASLVDAGILSRAKVERFRHKDTEQLQEMLQNSMSKNKFIVSDSVFSTNGNIAPVKKLAHLAEQYSAKLMIDDAHGIGVLGENGAGISEAFDLNQKSLAILVCPLGKAFGIQGGMVAGSADFIESLIQNARSYIYTNAIPPALAVAGLQSLELIREEKWRREKLNQHIEFFIEAARERNLPLGESRSPIQSILIGDPVRTDFLGNRLWASGFAVGIFRPPTTTKKDSMIRITLNVEHTEAQIISLLDCLVNHHE